MKDERPTIIELCAGIAISAAAFEREGFRIVGFAEVNPDACLWLNHKWPHVTNYGDVRTVPATRCNVIAAGFPCQDVSNSGPKTGLDGARSSLWFAVRDCIDRCRPDYVVIENSGALRSRGLDRVLSSLEQINYTPRAFSLDAMALGAPHHRERVYIFAHPAGVRQPGPGRCVDALHSAENPFREADRFVNAIQGNALPFLCRGHDGLPTRIRERALRLFGNSVVQPEAEIFARATYKLLRP